MYLSLDSPNLF